MTCNRTYRSLQPHLDTSMVTLYFDMAIHPIIRPPTQPVDRPVMHTLYAGKNSCIYTQSGHVVDALVK
ncbi:unnamed protein product [Protopolystoma xenopodis]|uniref:Uncharacterized protein n=1 Tax=Protopolystoma xenopodis TaxID=117903 RepID=A0A3S5B598_9PLAT|nr:unnamed protein product [Protopolystoma xenopodis]